MEFSQKLHALRKAHNLTQEQLAEQLFVSRTAISKWESNRGLPNLESLKAISELFHVSMDALLSDEELPVPCPQEALRKSQQHSLLVFSLLDLATLFVLFLPLFKTEISGTLSAVSLLHMLSHLRIILLVYTAVCGIWGLIQLSLSANCTVFRQKVCKTVSLLLSAGFALLLVAAQQPYATTFIIALLLGKQITSSRCR